MRPRRRFTRLAASVALIGLGMSAMAAAPALASPDHGKTVATLTHVDSPHAFWENDTFVLRGKFGDPEYPLIEDTVIWVGRGWDDRGRSNYTLRVPDREYTSFLGVPGQALYVAPAVPGFSFSPNWVGMGADRNIPIEKFRSREFSLDLLDVKGPGRVDMFNFRDPLPPTRLLSSHDPRFRSYWMSVGTHTHNYTAFTKPGRYELTYRVSARTTDGKLISSKPQTIPWQVGGPHPDEASVTDFAGAWQAAPAKPGADPGQPTLTLERHKVDPSEKRDADDLLTDLRVTTGKEADKGTVVFTIDGYYLAEAPLVNGQAIWTEMLGDEQNTIQAIYIPSSGDTPRWASAPLAYTRPGSVLGGESPASVTVTDGVSELVSPTPSQTPPFPATETTLSDTSVTFTTELIDRDKDRVHLRATSDNPHLYATVTGGVYDDDSGLPSCKISFTLANGSGDFIYEMGGCNDGGRLALTVTPHPYIAGDAKPLVDEKWTLDENTTMTARWDSATSTDGEQPEPVAPQPGTTPTDDTCTSAQPCVFSSGHLDVFYVTSPEPGKVRLAVKEDITGSEIVREPEEIVLKVNRQAYLGPGRSSFLPDGGYILPQTQDDRLLWPGWDTSDVRSNGFGKVEFHFDKVSGPGKIYAFSDGNLDQPAYSLTNADNGEIATGGVMEAPTPSHAHLYWGFSEPGTYSMAVHAVAYPNDEGERAVTRTHTFRWVVEDRSKKPAAPSPQPSKTFPPRPGTPTSVPTPSPSSSVKPSSETPSVPPTAGVIDTTDPSGTGSDKADEPTVDHSAHSDVVGPAASSSAGGATAALARTGLTSHTGAVTVFALGLVMVGVGALALRRELLR